MALTTFVKGRAYDWSHAIGRAAANGTGFNYPQTMCLGNDGDIFVANRGNENTFAMRVNRVKIGGPGEEELLAEFCTYGETDGHSIWPFGVAVDKHDTVYVTDEWTNTVSAFDAAGKFIRKWGTPGSGPGELKNPAGIICDAGGNVIVVDSGNDRLQVFTPVGKALTQYGRNGNGEGEFKMSIGKYGTLPVPENAFAVTYLGPFISHTDPPGYPKGGILNHPTDVAVDPDGDIYVADWGNHRLCIFDAEGTPLTHLVGDAQVMSKWGQQSIDANPDMMKAYRRARNLEPLWRFCFPTAVDFDPKTDRIIVADSQRNRLQIYRKMRDYVEFQANL